MILGAFFKAIGQLDDPRFRGVLAKGIGLTAGLLVAIYVIFALGVGAVVPDEITLPLIGTIGWVDNLASLGSVLLMLALSVFLMVPVASAFIGFFLEDVAEAVEARHYPDLAPVPRQALMDVALDTLAFLGVLIVANIVALLVYLALPFGAALIFWGLNGFLLGREYFQLVAMRRLGRAGAKEARKRHLPLIWAAGLLMAVPLTIPLVNLLVPVLGVATFTHLFMRVEKTRAA
ncbi:CysZ-like protein [Aquimixticola soesokkakensis]|uniref:CysZ-like protein n=1 Tax=Aquimixticola soesokkakensis TaxID=1519096 RepID=A0A1Y5RMH2_9RHOB|nr:EI24 domain-containing protein [Aquimixticola soesokkakensis]SLN20957.1 CysZ-like protein [Aquimixticola soesokkakensis]